MVRPPSRSTTKVSSVNRTSFTRSPGRGSEMPMPCLQQLPLARDDQPLNSTQLTGAKPRLRASTTSANQNLADMRRTLRGRTEHGGSETYPAHDIDRQESGK